MRTDVDVDLVRITAGPVTLEGKLSLPHGAYGIVLFAHGSGSSRHSPRNRHVAQQLNEASLATLLVDLLTEKEEAIDLRTAQLRFDIRLLAERLVGVTDWLLQQPDTRGLQIGYFGASTGAAAALVAAAERPDAVAAIVSRGGRPDLAGPYLPRVRALALLIVGGNDVQVIELNRTASPRTTALRQAARDRPRGNASVRGARRIRSGGAVGARVVRTLSLPRASRHDSDLAMTTFRSEQ
jgi:putative phosphoribosyl transferase